ncbi:L-ectoine synthase, partial [Auritidibacter sp. NML120779]
MYVINRDDTNDTERDVTSENWRSRRMVLAREGVGFSMHDTVIYAGTTSTFHYQNHIEAVYCVQGNGT